MAENDIPDVIVRWKARDPAKDTDRTAKAFCIPIGEIRENGYDLSISRYKKTALGEREYDLPDVILARLREVERAIAGDLDEIERLLQ